MLSNDYVTLGFAENGQFTNKKGVKKLSQSFLEDNMSRSVSAKMATNQLKISQKIDLDSFQGID